MNLEMDCPENLSRMAKFFTKTIDRIGMALITNEKLPSELFDIRTVLVKKVPADYRKR